MAKPRLVLEYTMKDFPEGLTEEAVAEAVTAAVKCAATKIGEMAGELYIENPGVSPLKGIRGWPKKPDFPKPDYQQA
ncbi:MAG: hypothetical protein ACFFB3_10290 [Candidatus Hodarchaeota archaeon]